MNTLTSKKVAKALDKTPIIGNKVATPVLKYRTELSSYINRIPLAPFKKAIGVLRAVTGGGKTLASSKLAARLAAEYGKKHIVYGTPFIILTEQTKNVLTTMISQDIAEVRHTHSKIRHKKSDNKRVKGLKCDVNICTLRKLEIALCEELGKNKDATLKNSVIIVDDASQHLTAEITPVFLHLLNEIRKKGALVILASGSLPDYDKVNLHIRKTHDVDYVDRSIQLFSIGDKLSSKAALEKRCNFVMHDEIYLDDVIDLMEKGKGPQLIIAETVKKSIIIHDELLSARRRGAGKARQGKPNLKGVKIFLLNGSQSQNARKVLLARVETLLAQKVQEKFILVSTSIVQSGFDASFEGGINDTMSYSGMFEHKGRTNRGMEYGKTCNLHVGPIIIPGASANNRNAPARTSALTVMHSRNPKTKQKLGVCEAGLTDALIAELRYNGFNAVKNADAFTALAKRGAFQDLSKALSARYIDQRRCPYFPSKKELDSALKKLSDELKKRGVRFQIIKPCEIELHENESRMTPKQILALVDEFLQEYACHMSEEEKKAHDDRMIPIRIRTTRVEADVRYYLLLNSNA